MYALRAHDAIAIADLTLIFYQENFDGSPPSPFHHLSRYYTRYALFSQECVSPLPALDVLQSGFTNGVSEHGHRLTVIYFFAADRFLNGLN